MKSWKLKLATTRSEWSYVCNSFAKSYSKNKVGKHLANIQFAVTRLMSEVSKDSKELLLIKDRNIIKAWVLHDKHNIHYACGSKEWINKLEVATGLEIKNSYSCFYMATAKGWRQ